jgi:hypothetical protein
MRKAFFITATFVVVFLSSSKTFSQANISIGAKGGISIPNLKSNSDNPVVNGWSSILTPYFGVVSEFNFSDHFSLQTELNYATEGGKKNGLQTIPTSFFFSTPPPGIPDTVYANFNSRVKLNYLELPILLKAQWPLNESFSFFLNGGPYAGYLLKAENTSSGKGKVYADREQTQPLLQQEISFDDNLDIKDELKNFTAGIQLGAGISFDMEAGKLVLTGGGNIGLIPIQKDSNNGKNTTGSAMVTIGYLFGW